MDHSPPGSSVHGVLQAITLEWVAIPFSRGSSWPREQTQVSRITGRFFTIWAIEPPGKPRKSTVLQLKQTNKTQPWLDQEEKTAACSVAGHSTSSHPLRQGLSSIVNEERPLPPAPLPEGVIWWTDSHRFAYNSVCELSSSPRRQRQGISNDRISQMLLSWEGVLAGEGAFCSLLGPHPLLWPGEAQPTLSAPTFCSDMELAVHLPDPRGNQSCLLGVCPIW